MEITKTIMTAYIIIMTDYLLISFCFAIIAQQDILILAFKNIGDEEKPQIS